MEIMNNVGGCYDKFWIGFNFLMLSILEIEVFKYLKLMECMEWVQWIFKIVEVLIFEAFWKKIKYH